MRQIARLVLALLLLTAPGRAPAQEVTFPQFSDPVPGADKVTYLDLAREIVADATVDANGWLAGNTIKALRHIAGADSRKAPPAQGKADTGISAIELADGRRHLMMFELGQPEGDVANYTVLALYDPAATPRLLDAVDVGHDLSNFFLNPAVLPLGGGDLILTMSLHFNASQAYQVSGMTLLRGDRFEFIDAVSTFDDKHCAFERTQRIAYDVQQSDTPFADIFAAVTETVTQTGTGCGGDVEAPPAGERTIAVRYAWDAAAGRYVPDSDAFERLAAENSERF